MPHPLLFLQTSQLLILWFIFQSLVSSCPLNLLWEQPVLLTSCLVLLPSAETPTEYTTYAGPHFGGAFQKLSTLSNPIGILLPGKINGRISPSRLNVTATLLMNSPMFIFLLAMVDNLENYFLRESKDWKNPISKNQENSTFFFSTFLSNSLTTPVPRIFSIQSELFCLVMLNVSSLCFYKVKHSLQPQITAKSISPVRFTLYPPPPYNHPV